jgi:hypothetical protein
MSPIKPRRNRVAGDPWVRDKPSSYVREHLRATISPTLIPGRGPAAELARLPIAFTPPATTNRQEQESRGVADAHRG